jgi:hypothetical protein
MSREKHYPTASILYLLTLLLGPLSAQARDYIYQNPETQNSFQVQVQNKTAEEQPVWVLFYEDEFIEEQSFDLPANSTKILNLDGLKKPNWNFAVLSKTAKVAPVGKDWEWSPSSRYEMKLKKQKEIKLKFFNLYIEKQKVTLSYINSQNTLLQKVDFYSSSFRQSLERIEKVPAGATRLIVESEAPLQMISSEVFMPVTDSHRTVSGEFKYFLVQASGDSSSFVAPIDDPVLIQKAREEILEPKGNIVFADIELNKEQANRNFASPEKYYWSWAVKKVTGMSQIGADWCQAYPEMIERMLHGFLRQESVCFRGQRIIRELKPSEVQSGVLNN